MKKPSRVKTVMRLVRYGRVPSTMAVIVGLLMMSMPPAHFKEDKYAFLETRVLFFWELGSLQ
jgi:hypothetical protein